MSIAGYSGALSSWLNMLRRCLDPLDERSYANYGGRGIVVCLRWMEFKNFYADMGDRPKGVSMDRIDHNGNYEPGNCRWASKREQARNMRSNVWIGDELQIDVAARLGVHPSTVSRRRRAQAAKADQ